MAEGRVRTRHISIAGQVQGVGFRPFVYRVAMRLGIAGNVRNHPGGVEIEATAAASVLDEFQHCLVAEAPGLARVEEVEVRKDRPGPADHAGFRIIASAAGGPAGRITVDTACCADCTRELFDEADRRLGHGLINCTGCGPRYTIATGLPWDRANTTMGVFPLCDLCREEYEDPANRRFHAEPVCCPGCGPQIRLVFAEGAGRHGRRQALSRGGGRRSDGSARRRRRVALRGGIRSPLGRRPDIERQRRRRVALRGGIRSPLGGSGAVPTALPGKVTRLPLWLVGRQGGGEPIGGAAAILRQGGILAIKGLGGYHLAVDAQDGEAVARLRQLKGRDQKPFALMVRDLKAARELVTLSAKAEILLGSPEAPIVLTARVGEDVADSVAFDSHRLGVMLPNTPIQHLLAAAFEGPLVMTSMNRSDDPLIHDDAAARSFGSEGVSFLLHDRKIERAVDDSVFADHRAGLVPVRRARGYVPAPIHLPVKSAEPGLAVGGDLKSVVAVVRGGEAILSQHLGDLEHPEACRRFRETVADLLTLFEIEPRWIAADLHPGYHSRRFAEKMAADLDIPILPVQHHHAHLAAAMAEHGRAEPTVGLTLDGFGYGEDGTSWGGEVLLGDLNEFTRLGHLRPLLLPGGDAAAKETGRCALAWLFDYLGAGFDEHPLAIRAIPDEDRRRALAEMLATGVRCPASTGAGRLFDAAASLTSLCTHNEFEAMSGMALEAAAFRARRHPSGQGVIPLTRGCPFQMDHRPLLAAMIEMLKAGEPVEDVAWFFHDALADVLSRAAVRAGRASYCDTVALTGGVFLNGVLSDLVVTRLQSAGFSPLLHREVPPGDGGLALGQAAVMAGKG